jgi:hypothetical protein
LLLWSVIRACSDILIFVSLNEINDLFTSILFLIVMPTPLCTQSLLYSQFLAMTYFFDHFYKDKKLSGLFTKEIHN